MAITTIGSPGAPNSASLPAASQGPQSAALKKPAPVVPASEPQQSQPQPAQVQKAIESMKQMIEAKAPNTVAFSVDSTSGRTIVKIMDASTGDTIRQIPSEEMLEIARSIDKLQGLLIKGKA